MPFDPASPAAALAAAVRMSASLDGAECVTLLRGDAYASGPGANMRQLFGVEGFAIGRAIEVDDGYALFGRRVLFPVHPSTGGFLRHFENPITGDRNTVDIEWVDPYVVPLLLPRCADSLVTTQAVDSLTVRADVVGVSVHITATGPTQGAGPTWVRVIASVADVGGPNAGVPGDVSIVLQRPWFGWMRMADADGHLVCHVGGSKLAGGYGELPAHLRAAVEAERPEFAFAPRSLDSQPVGGRRRQRAR